MRLFADGAAVKQVGAHPWEITRDTVDDAVTVTTDEICSAIRLIFEDLRSIAEPAGVIGRRCRHSGHEQGIRSQI